MSEDDDKWVRDSQCSKNYVTWFLEWFMIIKAIIIIISNFSGMRFYWRKELYSYAVIFCLFCSVIVIVLEVFIYRYWSDRDLRLRYFIDTASMWLVFSTFNFIMVFAYKAGAAHFRGIHFRWYLLPIHGLYLTMALIGINSKDGAYCNQDVYPDIYMYQYGIFYNCYVLYVWMYFNGFFITWDEKALTSEQLEQTPNIDHETRVKTQARLIFM